MEHPMVTRRFARLLFRLAPPTERPEVEQRRLSAIRARLAAAFDVRRIGYWGSHSKGTAVKGVSDVDMFALMSRAEARKWSPDESSVSLIRRIRNELQHRYWSTSVRRDEQAVVLGFTDGFRVDVVPAVFDRFTGSPEYRIPDGNGDWIVTAPAQQRELLQAADVRSGRRLRPLIRLVKYWASCRAATEDLRSYYVETALMRWRVPIGMAYQAALASVFRNLADERLGTLADPVRSSDRVYACNTANQRDAILDALTNAADRATVALNEESGRDGVEAVRRWNLIFNYCL